MVFLGFSMEHQGLSIRHHRFSKAHHGCDPVHHGTPWGFHRFPWYFHGSPWGIEGMEHGTPWVKHSHAISVLPHVHANLHMPFAELLIASTFKAHNRGEGISSEHATLYLFQM